jgi:hypothetical protein
LDIARSVYDTSLVQVTNKTASFEAVLSSNYSLHPFPILSYNSAVMKTNIKKLLLTIVLFALVTACSVTPGEPTDLPSDQNTTAPSTPSTSAILNKNMIYTNNESELFEGNQRTAFLTALENGKQQFSVNQVNYSIDALGEGSYRIFRLVPIAESLLGNLEAVGENLLPEELIEAIQTALAEDAQLFEHQGITYEISKDRKATQISTRSDAVIVSTFYVEPYDRQNNEIIHTHEFMLNLGLALERGEKNFSYEEDQYGILTVPGGYSITDSELNLFAEYSNIYVIPQGSNEDIPLAFKNKVREAIETDMDGFVYTDNTGQQTEYQIEQLEDSWTITQVSAR